MASPLMSDEDFNCQFLYDNEFVPLKFSFDTVILELIQYFPEKIYISFDR